MHVTYNLKMIKITIICSRIIDKRWLKVCHCPLSNNFGAIFCLFSLIANVLAQSDCFFQNGQ